MIHRKYLLLLLLYYTTLHATYKYGSSIVVRWDACIHILPRYSLKIFHLIKKNYEPVIAKIYFTLTFT